MTEYLHNKLRDTLKAHGINPALSEDEINSYPYVTFELPVEYRYDKDGPYKIVGNLTIRSVSDDFDQADALRASIESAIAQGFGGPSSAAPAEEAEDVEDLSEVLSEDPVEEPAVNPEPAEEAEEEIVHDYDSYTFTARITDVRKDCMDGIWVIEQDYIINQQ